MNNTGTNGTGAHNLFQVARAKVDRGFIEYHFGAPGAYWKGDNYYTLNPTRDDHEIGSFLIRADGVWFENAAAPGSGLGQHGDVFDLLAHMQGRSTVEVARELAGEDVDSTQLERPASDAYKTMKGIEPDWVAIPEGKRPVFRSEPSDVTTYHQWSTGQAMFMVIRYDHPAPNPKKEIFPAYWDGVQFKKGLPPSLKGKTALRPLFLFDRKKTVLVVEGEMKRRLAASFLEENGNAYAVTCWHGGAAQGEHIELDPLYGCDVILSPDNDDVGKAVMAEIAVKLRGRATVRWLEPPPGVPKAWDLGDAVKEGRDIRILLEASAPFVYADEAIDPTIEDVPLDLPIRPFTDLGNAERFIDRHGSRVRYSIEKKCWLTWSGKVWAGGDPAALTPYIKETIRSIPDAGDKESAAWAEHSESAWSIKSMLSLATAEPNIALHEEDFDPNPFELNCQSGIIDLRTGRLEEHRRESLCSKIAPLEYKPDAKCSLFLRFLDDISMGRSELVEFWQRWFGYSMTGDVSAQSFAIFYGNGANGKSTLVELISRIMGAYAKSAPPDTFVQKANYGSSIPNDVASLRGARMVLTTETEANAKLAESKIKSLTGGDRVVARFLHGEFFDFPPTWKVIISTNHRPKVSGGDYGIWRRIVLVPFDFFATGDKLDPDLPRKLWAEREGIFSWLVEGAVKWHQGGQGRKGLGIGPLLESQAQEYRVSEDILGRFLLEGCFQRGDPDCTVPPEKWSVGSTDLLNCYKAWCEREGDLYAAKISATSFGRAMRERGYQPTVFSGGRHGFKGICPRSITDQDRRGSYGSRREEDEE